MGTTKLGVAGVAVAVDSHGCFLLRLPRNLFRGCCGFELRFFRPGRLPGGGHYGLLGRP